MPSLRCEIGLSNEAYENFLARTSMTHDITYFVLVIVARKKQIDSQ